MDGDLQHADTPDTELIRRIGMGDVEAFEEFHRRYSGLVYSTVWRVLGNQADTEEVAQEVLFMIWEKSPMYDPSRGKPLTWAVTMARNKAIDRLRSVQRRLRLNDDYEQEIVPSDTVFGTRPLDEVEAGERGGIVRSAVLRLSREQREVIELAYFGGLTQQEISERLDKPIGTVKARIRRGMLRLKRIVGTKV
jgi:RNA polymerase sigma-70 factor, ECF subfamily